MIAITKFLYEQNYVVPPAVAATAKRLGLSDRYQYAMNQAFNQFKRETGRLPQVAGHGQTGPVNPADQARIDDLHKKYMAGMPAAPPRPPAAPTAPTAKPPVEAPPVAPPAPTAKPPVEAPPPGAGARQVVVPHVKDTDISGSQAAGIALKKGLQATGEALGSGARKSMEFAGEHPVAAGIAAGAVGALGLRKLLRGNRQVT